MKIDMHCHVKEGSIDSRVGIEEYIEILKKKGFQGMVITDHDTYNGYRYWKENIKGKKHTDFVVLKGIEYDTIKVEITEKQIDEKIEEVLQKYSDQTELKEGTVKNGDYVKLSYSLEMDGKKWIAYLLKIIPCRWEKA